MKAGDVMADIYKELYSVKNGRYGSDIRTAIHDSLEKIDAELDEKDPKSDITSELETIASDPYGRNVKQAIYNALVKVNNAKTTGGDAAEPEVTTLLTTAAHPEPIWPEAVADFTPDE